LRQASRQLDRKANDLEDTNQFEDADQLLENWGGGALGASATDYYASLHRVAYYGDHTRSIRHLAHLLGLKVVVEG